MQNWSEYLPILRLVVSSVEGYGIVPLIDWLKTKWRRLTGQDLGSELTLILTFGVCLILAGLTLIIEGQLSPADFEPAALVTTFVTVFTVAKVRYDMARKKQAKKPGPGIFLDDPELEELIKNLPY